MADGAKGSGQQEKKARHTWWTTVESHGAYGEAVENVCVYRALGLRTRVRSVHNLWSGKAPRFDVEVWA